MAGGIDSESDGIDEALTGQIRVAVTAGGHIAEGVARGREQQQRRARAAGEYEALAVESRLAAERRAARAELASVYRPEWWAQATPERIGRMFEVAAAWSREDPEAMRAEQRIAAELRSRYGIDTARAHTDPAAVRSTIERREQHRAQADERRQRSAEDQAEAHALIAHAEQQDRRAEEQRSQDATQDARQDPPAAATRTAESESLSESASTAPAESQQVDAGDLGGAEWTLFDSVERREATARDLEARGIGREAVAAKMYADVSQAKPATEAITTAGRRRTAVARRSRHRGAQVQRSGVER